MPETTIQSKTNGPYVVIGDFTLLDANGNKVELPNKTGKVSLCRCGASATKPICDGAHKKLTFEASPAASGPTAAGPSTPACGQ